MAKTIQTCWPAILVADQMGVERPHRGVQSHHPAWTTPEVPGEFWVSGRPVCGTHAVADPRAGHVEHQPSCEAHAVADRLAGRGAVSEGEPVADQVVAVVGRSVRQVARLVSGAEVGSVT